jgi:hypothetical protein
MSGGDDVSTKTRIYETVALPGGRTLHVIQTDWDPDTGNVWVTYDVDDAETGLTLTEYSLTSPPPRDEVMALLRDLRDGAGSEFFTEDEETQATLRAIFAAAFPEA